jgi:endonuclease/exonuclease/phosphatase family metal-dependent hydrolase
MDARRRTEWFQVATLRRLALPALVTVLGMQSLRVYFPSLAWYLRDTVGVGSITLGAIAFATFALGFLAPLVRRAFGSRGALWFAGGGLAGLRVLEQFSSSPSLDLFLSLACTGLFLVFLSAFIGHTRAADGPAGPQRITGGLIAGLALDTFVKGVAGSLDLSWTPSSGAALVILALATLTLWLIAVEPAPLNSTPSDVPWSRALPLVGLGALFLLEAMILLNQGWVAQVSGIGSSTAFAVLMLGLVAMAAGAGMAFARPSLHRMPIAALAALLVFVAAPRSVELAAYLPLVVLLIQFTLGWGLGLITLRGADGLRTGLGRTSVSVTAGLLLYLLLAFIYYVSFDISLPLPRAWVVPLASLVYAACMLGAVAGAEGRAASRELTVVVATGGLAVLGIVIVLLTQPAVPGEPAAPTGRVMTFNLHSAFNRDGRLDPEAIARVIAARQPDVVALQEVSRGWMIDGSVDLVGWLARRLGMHVVFEGTADPIWGNAILSRSGFIDHGSAPLPGEGTLLPRGFLWAHVDVGLDEPLLVIATHLHHIAEEPEPRLAQIPVLLDFWDGADHAVLMGDLNSEPTWPEMALIEQAGLVDAWSEAGQGPGLTWPADDPFQRIDWIWMSPDLEAISAETVEGTASDHRAVLADLAER